MNNAFTVFYIIFLVSAVVYQILVEHKADEAEKANKGRVYFGWTHLLINLTYLSVIIIPAVEYFLIKRKINPVVSVAGIVLVAGGIWGRNYSIKILGKYWSGDIEARVGHKIVKEGPYAYMRHPAYLAMILNGLGLCLMPNSYYSAVFVFGIYVISFIIRVI